MTIQQKLLQQNLVEGVDYSLVNGVLKALPKVRQIPQIIHHPAIAEVVGLVGHGIIPAVFDAQGVEISPSQPAQPEIIAVAPVAAWEETIFIPETYFEQLPDLDAVKVSCFDISELIGEYLAGKDLLRDIENDSLNIANGQIHSWNFKNIPCPSIADLAALTVNLEAKHSREAKLKQIHDLEAQVTPRKLREAVLSGNTSAILAIDAQITAIRATL
jgi:hypothetical protein